MKRAVGLVLSVSLTWATPGPAQQAFNDGLLHRDSITGLSHESGRLPNLAKPRIGLAAKRQKPKEIISLPRPVEVSVGRA